MDGRGWRARVLSTKAKFVGGNWFVDVVDVTVAGNVSKDFCWLVAVATVAFFSIEIIKSLPVSVDAMLDRSSALSSSRAVVGEP